MDPRGVVYYLNPRSFEGSGFEDLGAQVIGGAQGWEFVAATKIRVSLAGLTNIKNEGGGFIKDLWALLCGLRHHGEKPKFRIRLRVRPAVIGHRDWKGSRPRRRSSGSLPESYRLLARLSLC